MKKIFIYGSGQLGINAAAYLLASRKVGNAEVVLFSPHNFKRVEGAIADLSDTQAMIGQVSNWHFRASGDVADMVSSDFVFFCAGKFPKPEEYVEAAKKGIDDRLLQAVQNIEILKEFCSNVRQLSPKAKVFIITNPVDLMTDIARENLPNQEVYGLGCYLDTSRFKRELKEQLEETGIAVDISAISAWIIGHHCGSMFLHRGSLHFQGIDKCQDLEEVLQTALSKTRSRGLTITNINAASTDKKINNGAYFAPAVMIADVMAACVGNTPLTLPLNRLIEEDEGEFSGRSAQLLTKIQAGSVTPLRLDFSAEETKLLEASIIGQLKSRDAIGL